MTRTAVLIPTRLVVIGFLALSGVAQGHNLWVTAEGETVRIVFEHSPAPGEGAYNAEILRGGETWARTADQKGVTPVRVQETGQAGSLHLMGSTVVTGPRAIEHSCLFGIYRGRLDYFYGKFLDVANAGELESLARAARLSLDIVPRLNGRTLELTVLWHGELLAEHMFGVVTPDENEISLQANDEGVITFEPVQPGIYGFWVIRMDDEAKGEYEGEKYSGTMHGTTLSLRWPFGDKGK